jgi:hypothetical protein
MKFDNKRRKDMVSDMFLNSLVAKTEQNVINKLNNLRHFKEKKEQENKKLTDTNAFEAAIDERQGRKSQTYSRHLSIKELPKDELETKNPELWNDFVKNRESRNCYISEDG